MGECTDVWGIQKLGGCIRGIQIYGQCTNIQGMYRCMGGVQTYMGHTDVWGMYRCKGHTDIWGMYWGIQMYGGIQTHSEHTDGGSYRYCPDIQTARHPHMPANYTLVLYFL